MKIFKKKCNGVLMNINLYAETIEGLQFELEKVIEMMNSKKEHSDNREYEGYKFEITGEEVFPNKFELEETPYMVVIDNSGFINKKVEFETMFEKEHEKEAIESLMQADSCSHILNGKPILVESANFDSLMSIHSVDVQYFANDKFYLINKEGFVSTIFTGSEIPQIERYLKNSDEKLYIFAEIDLNY